MSKGHFTLMDFDPNDVRLMAFEMTDDLWSDGNALCVQCSDQGIEDAD